MPYPATSKIGGVANTDREGRGSINRINIEGERKTGGMRSGRDTEASSILNASKPSGVPASQNSLRLQPSYPTAATREKGWRFPRWLLCRKRYRALLGHRYSTCPRYSTGTPWKYPEIRVVSLWHAFCESLFPDMILLLGQALECRSYHTAKTFRIHYPG